MKRSCTIAVFAVLMLCVISSPYATETINPDSTTVHPIYKLASVSTTPTLATASRNEYIVAPSSLPPTSLIYQKESQTLVTGIFDKSINKVEGENNDVPTPECQRTIKQLGLFITSWNKGPQRQDHHFCWMLTEDCFYPRKKFPVDLYRNVATACAIGKGSAWKGKTHNLRCTDQLQSLKESVDKLIAAVAVTSHYPPSHPIWTETEEDCSNYGLCEFQLESTRHAVMNSYSKTWAACNMN
ncbi:MAG TPA: hypothetical protein EYQ26_14390 [Rhodospirillales bacterium]|nr:hypothetical protein [Rhodospirillales bacterium]